MTEISGLDRLIAIEEIKQLKARYLRYVDTKQWDLLPTVFTDDCTFSFEGIVAGQLVTYGSVAAFMPFVSTRMQSASTAHQGHAPEIVIHDGTRASGIWPMTDIVQRYEGDPLQSFAGYGHYHEEYRKGVEWRIGSVHLSRLLRIEFPNVPAPLQP